MRSGVGVLDLRSGFHYYGSCERRVARAARLRVCRFFHPTSGAVTLLCTLLHTLAGKEGLKDGFGSYTMPSGDAYVGEFKAGLRHGRGFKVRRRRSAAAAAAAAAATHF